MGKHVAKAVVEKFSNGETSVMIHGEIKFHIKLYRINFI